MKFGEPVSKEVSFLFCALPVCVGLVSFACESLTLLLTAMALPFFEALFAYWIEFTPRKD
jgi:hypothetical protein